MIINSNTISNGNECMIFKCSKKVCKNSNECYSS